MAPIIRDVGIHFMVGENLTVQRDRCSKQELEMVLRGEVAIFHAVPLDVGTVGGRELSSSTVHHVEKGVDRLRGNNGIVTTHTLFPFTSQCGYDWSGTGMTPSDSS